MGRGIDNYYLILELDFMKPESDVQVIDKRIKEKIKFWGANCERGKNAQRYRTYKDNVMMIAKVMKEENSRKAEAADAKKFVQGVLKEQLSFFAGRTEIEEEIAKKIMAMCGIWPEMFERLSKLKIVKGASKETNAVNPNPKPNYVDKFKSADDNLRSVGAENLYYFLADNQANVVVGLQSLGEEELVRSYSNPLKDRVKNLKDEYATAVRTLCSLCEEIFNPKNSLKADYDRYIVWKKIDDIIGRIKVFSGQNNTIDDLMQELFVKELTQLLRDRNKAVEKFEQICIFYKIQFMRKNEPSTTTAVVCGHCFKTVDISHGEEKCSECGKELYITCPNPKCRKKILLSVQACGHCGQKMENVKNAAQLCSIAEEALQRMEYEKATDCVNRAERLFNGYDKIARLRETIKAEEGKISKEIAELDDLVRKKAFYQAKVLLGQIQRKAPGISIPNANIICSSVEQAEKLYKTALAETAESALIKRCSEITAVCSDYPGVEALVVKYPPSPASNVILVSAGSSAIQLSWNASTSAGDLSYVILRKENTAAISIKDPDAVEVGRAGTTRFVDNSVKPGIDYYYSVYTVRAGVVSSAVFAHDFNISELNIIRKEEGSGYVKVEWTKTDSNVKTEVWRCVGKIPVKRGEGTLVPSTSSGFTDNNVSNDEQYGYLMIAVYQIGGTSKVTEGVKEILTPSSAPEPVYDLTVKNVEDDLFEGTWTYDGTERVALYYTTDRVSIRCGDTKDLASLNKIIRPVDATATLKGKCRFQLLGNKRYTIIPVTIKSNTAVIGEFVTVSKTEKLKIISTKLVNTSLRIAINWPEDVTSITVLYGTERYAKDVTDRSTVTMRTISKKQFLVEGALVLPNIVQEDYYITLFTVARANGSVIYSEGTQVFFGNKPKENILYTILVQGIFSKKVYIRFRSESGREFHLPEIDVIAKKDGPPVTPAAGNVLCRITSQKVADSLTQELDLTGIPKNSYVKPFFKDPNNYDEISLKPVTGTRFKIN